MKHLLLMALIGLLSFGTNVKASDLEITVIGGEAAAFEQQTIDDMALGQTYRVDGFALFSPVSFAFYDSFVQYYKDRPGDNSHNTNGGSDPAIVYWDTGNWYHTGAFWNDSGTSAEFAWLVADITNLQKKDVNMMENASVTVYYNDDEYEFQGWIRQFNHDYYTTVYRKGIESTYYTTGTDDNGRLYTDYALDPENEEPIGQMYTGHYVFGCTLPNLVVEEKDTSLRMVIKLDGNEFTYYIRH